MITKKRMTLKGRSISGQDELQKRYNENITVVHSFVIDAMGHRGHYSST